MANEDEVRIRHRAAGPIRITLPAKVAYNPDVLKKSIASIAEQIGHPRCFSGADCFFQMERRFVLDPEGQAVASAGGPGWSQGPTPNPWTVSAGLSSGVKYDLEKVLFAVDKVIDLIGPHPCISGFDVFFRDQLDLITVNEGLEAQRFGQKF